MILLPASYTPPLCDHEKRGDHNLGPIWTKECLARISSSESTKELYPGTPAAFTCSVIRWMRKNLLKKNGSTCHIRMKTIVVLSMKESKVSSCAHGYGRLRHRRRPLYYTNDKMVCACAYSSGAAVWVSYASVAASRSPA